MGKMILRWLAKLSGTALPEDVDFRDDEKIKQARQAIQRQPLYEAELRAFRSREEPRRWN